MDAFDYLAVLLSIILGLAIQQVLQGYRALILSRARVRFYGPPLVWSAFILAMVAQHWWASFGLAGRSEWSFADFAACLLVTALIYMAAAIVLPDVRPQEELDLERHYYDERTAFFGLLLAAVAASVLREVQLEGRLPEPTNLAFHGVFAAVALVGLATRTGWVHKLLAGAVTVSFVAYVWALFGRLG
ncbi:hypothetical protein GCM10022280_01840 [Sphingomonas swuensis]|uniref:Uncharacterized protein n=1 Tax=Sphingomonas swuensis TaxID=977800 RepID=A0ABP7S9I6_9SPHN